MIITKDIHKIKELRAEQANLAWGYVPTMGALHSGHISLIKRAIDENDICLVSIFVNPMQFNNPKDLEKYPRDIDKDIELLNQAGVDILFIPDAQDFYPAGFDITVSIKTMASVLEGKARNGHFDGVCTVLTKFFNIVSPQKAYFGQKDAQQLLIVKKLVQDLNYNIDIIGCPIFRDNRGLALSSRNERLTAEQDEIAPILYQSLKLAKQLIIDGHRKSDEIILKMTRMIESKPFAKIDYIAITDTETLSSVKEVNQEVLISMAVFLGDVRLIDNITLIP